MRRLRPAAEPKSLRLERSVAAADVATAEAGSFIDVCRLLVATLLLSPLLVFLTRTPEDGGGEP